MSQRQIVVVLALALVGLASVGSTGAAEPTTNVAPTNRQIEAARQAIRQRGYSSQRLLALGQAQLAASATGPAIVSFERGLLLAPRDRSLREALAAARARAGLGKPSDSRLVTIGRTLSAREWSFLAFGSCVVFVLSLALTFRSRFRRLALGVITLASLTLALSSGGWLVSNQQLKSAFVLREGSLLRQSPFPTAAAVSELRPGEAVVLGDEHAGFVYVRSERGDAGWVQKTNLEWLAAPAPNAG